MYLWRWRKIHAEAETKALQDSDSELNSDELNGEEKSSSEYSSESEGRGANDEPEISDFHSEVSYEDEPVSSESEEEFHDVPEEEQKPFTEKLASLCSKNKQTRKSTNELLALLREEGLPVPKDSPKNTTKHYCWRKVWRAVQVLWPGIRNKKYNWR